MAWAAILASLKEMNISGILVLAAPAQVEAVAHRLRALDGVDIHHVESATGRIIVTQEAESVAAEIDGLKRIRTIAGVVMAEMAYHWFEEDASPVDTVPPELEGENLDTSAVPPFLND